jgi:uncharacterized protein YydD (DUF2326 family)
MTQPVSIDTNQLLQIIGAKEVEIQVLREKINWLESKNKESKPLEQTEVNG